jgi:DNA-binding MarR family transcriptional regulator
MEPPDTVAKRIASGLGRLALAFKTRAWKSAGDEGITPTQGEALARLGDASSGMRLNDLARQLGVSAPTASDAVAALVAKALVEKRAGDDKRSVILKLTAEGKRLADRTADWTDFMVQAVETLDDEERENFLLALVKIIRGLQESGEISPQRMCVTCEHFRAHAHQDAAAPHHCAFIDAAFGAEALRLNCGDHRQIADDLRAQQWARFLHLEHQV